MLLGDKIIYNRDYKQPYCSEIFFFVYFHLPFLQSGKNALQPWNSETRDLFSLNPWPEQQRLNIQLHNFMFTSSSFSGFAPVPADTVKNTEGGLTILTSIYLQSESNPPSGVPVKRNQAEVAGYHGLFQFVLDHRVCITVSWKSLKQHDNIQYFRYPNSNIQPSMFYYSSQHLME